MKRLISISAIAIIMAVVACSCSKEDKTPKSNMDAVEMLKFDIANLNCATFGENPETRARWWRFLITAVADAGVGLLTGNVGYGISASALVWNTTKDRAVSNSLDENSINDPEVAMAYLVNDDWMESDSDANGEIHNRVIINLYNKYGEGMFELQEAVLISEVAKEVAALTGVSPSEVIPNIDQVVIDMRNYTNAYVNATTIDEYIGELKKIDPSKAVELDILKVTLDGFQFVDIEIDNGTYVNNVMTIIDNSDIAPSVKKEVKSGVAIANASVRLWNTSALEF